MYKIGGSMPAMMLVSFYQWDFSSIKWGWSISGRDLLPVPEQTLRMNRGCSVRNCWTAVQASHLSQTVWQFFAASGIVSPAQRRRIGLVIYAQTRRLLARRPRHRCCRGKLHTWGWTTSREPASVQRRPCILGTCVVELSTMVCYAVH